MVISLLARAENILNLMSAGQGAVHDEEEILITVKRKRGSSQPVYMISSSSRPGVEQQLVPGPGLRQETTGEIGVETDLDGEENLSSEDHEMDIKGD